jgi:hypothetical protein
MLHDLDDRGVIAYPEPSTDGPEVGIRVAYEVLAAGSELLRFGYRLQEPADVPIQGVPTTLGIEQRRRR